YALGVMAAETSQYEFPSDVRKSLLLKDKFAAFVAIMQPRLIVVMGAYAQGYLGVVRGPLASLCGTKAIAIWHPSARYKSRADFELEGQRIRDALRVA
ncbi:MAG: uracil-DNA glycosylase family protein, partial [Candidatus Eremiobacteraeota bacterium]|nr:uracil-DNA glycosylase family protein [Candidatus Eremiobacteraeota bacterium]